MADLCAGVPSVFFFCPELCTALFLSSPSSGLLRAGKEVCFDGHKRFYENTVAYTKSNPARACSCSPGVCLPVAFVSRCVCITEII